MSRPSDRCLCGARRLSDCDCTEMCDRDRCHACRCAIARELVGYFDTARARSREDLEEERGVCADFAARAYVGDVLATVPSEDEADAAELDLRRRTAHARYYTSVAVARAGRSAA